MASKTLQQKRRESQARRDKLRANKMCIQCGQNPATENADGSLSVRCDDCRQTMANRKSRHRPNQHLIYDADMDPTPLSETEVFKTALIDIGLHVHDVKSCTVGSISRKFPAYDCIIWDILKMLKLDAIVDFNEYSAAPTWVYARSMRMAQPIKFKNTSIWAKTQTPGPDASSFEDSKYKVTA